MTDGVRVQILRFVRRYPAVHLRELERRLGLTDRLAAYHLTRLVAEGLVARVDDKGYTRYWAAGAKWDADTLRLSRLLRREPAYKITLLLLQNDGMAHGEIAARLGLSKATTSYHLGLLKRANVVRLVEDGRNRFYFAKDPEELRRLLRQLPPLPGSLDKFSELWDDLVG